MGRSLLQPDENPIKQIRSSQFFWLFVSGIACIAMLIITIFAIQIATVRGYEMGVLETWNGGVAPDALPPRTYFLFPGWSQTIYRYNMGSEAFVMSDDSSDKNRDTGAYIVPSSEGQEMRISLAVRWRRDPTKLIELHKSLRDDIEMRLIMPAVMLIVKNEVTMRTAIEAYSGEGLVKLQRDIHNDLTNPNNELRLRGVIIENFVIENIKLDPKYIGEITARQVAMQAKLRADEETKASNAQALKAQADAKADFNKQVVEAERDARKQVIAAEAAAEKTTVGAKAEAERTIVAAEASRKQVVLAAEGEKEAGLLKAQAIKAVGESEAEVTKLKLSAYSVPGSENFTRVEVAKHLSDGFSNVKGYLPADMKINVLSESFTQALDSLMGKTRPPAVGAPR